MKVLLIHPPPLADDVQSDVLYPPLGLAYVASALKADGHEVNIYDANALRSTINDTAKYVTSFKPEVVGITATTPAILDAFSVAKAVKEYDQETPVIMGGVHPTINPEHTLKNPHVDYVVIGEGEQTTPQLLSAIEEGNINNKIEGIAFKKGKQVKINSKRPLIKDLDTIPYPAYELLPIEKYVCPQSSKKPFMTMITSRGCPFSCIFCDVQVVFGRTYRTHSPERSIAEIKYLMDEFGVKEIFFKDSEFTLDNKRVEKICDMIMEEGININWLCNGRVTHVTEKLLKKMKKAGCRFITYGVESGDQRMLDTLKKQIKLDDARNAFKWTRDVGIRTVANFMIGGPGETRESVKKTLDFAIELDPDYVQFNCATPFPGTELYDLAVKNDWMLEKDLEKIRYDTCIMNATKIPTEELCKMPGKQYLAYYLRPGYILNHLRKLNIQELKMNLRGLKILLSYTRPK